MWPEILSAMALVLVIEGMLPFLSPRLTRQAFISVLRMDDISLRVSGFVSMVLGVVILYVIK